MSIFDKWNLGINTYSPTKMNSKAGISHKIILPLYKPNTTLNQFISMKCNANWICILLLVLLPKQAFLQTYNPISLQTTEKHTFIYNNTDTALISNYWQQARKLQNELPDSAIRLLNIASEKSKQIAYTYGVTRSLAHAGTIHAHIGNYPKSIALLKESIGYAKSAEKGEEILPIIYKDLGGVYMLKGDYENAAKYSYHAAMLVEQATHLPNKVNILNNLAVVMLTLENPSSGISEKKAYYYLQLAEQFAIASKDSANITTALLNRGSYYIKKGNWQQANDYLQKALGISRRQNGFKEKEHNSLLFLGQLQYAQGKYEDALVWLNAAAALKGNINPYYQLTNLALMGNIYFKTQHFDKALYALQHAEVKAKKLGLTSNLMDIHLKLYEIYKQTQQETEALKHYEAYIQIKDSITGKETLNNIHQLELKYSTVQKDKELLQKQIQITNQTKKISTQNSWIYIISGCLLLICLLFITIYIILRSKQRIQKQRLYTIEQSYEIAQLKAKIEGEEKERNRLARELHNGIGSLLTAVRINYMALGKNNKELQASTTYQEVLQMLTTLSRDVRKTSHSLMPEILLNKTLPQAIENYCDLIRNNDTLKADIQAYGQFERLPSEFTLLTYRVVQELIQNIVKHAQASNLIVQLLVNDSQISITVEDNGRGFSENKQPNGMGLQSLKALVNSINGTFSIQSSPGEGTSVYIEIPLENYIPDKIA